MIVAADDPLFSMPLGVNEEPWTVWLTREGVWERYRTLGQVAILEGEELAVSTFLTLIYPLPIWKGTDGMVLLMNLRDAENSQGLRRYYQWA